LSLVSSSDIASGNHDQQKLLQDLVSFLEKADASALDMFEKNRAVYDKALSDDAEKLKHYIEVFDFDRAAALLKQYINTQGSE